MFDKKKEVFLALQCSKCKRIKTSWELSMFMDKLGEEYKRQGYVMQSCCTLPNSNTEHHIVGVVEMNQIPKSDTKVFDLYEKNLKG